jgi:hypothetical protein
LSDHGQVATHQHLRVDRACGNGQPPKLGAELRRAAGDVHHRRLVPLHPADDAIRGRGAHDLLAARTRTHVTVDTGLVAELADVDLQHARTRAPQIEAVVLQDRLKGAGRGVDRGHFVSNSFSSPLRLNSQ